MNEIEAWFFHCAVRKGILGWDGLGRGKKDVS